MKLKVKLKGWCDYSFTSIGETAFQIHSMRPVKGGLRDSTQENCCDPVFSVQ